MLLTVTLVASVLAYQAVAARLPAGIAAATVADTGFGTEFFDYDNDGLLDLFSANGAVTIIERFAAIRFPSGRGTACCATPAAAASWMSAPRPALRLAWPR